MIDESLTWRAQVDHIITKVTSGLSILRRLRDIVEHNTKLMVYKSLTQLYFDYCSHVWGCLGATLSNKLQRLQNSCSDYNPTGLYCSL